MFLDTLEAWDQSFSLWINSFNSPFTDGLWLVMSNVKLWYPMYLVVAGLLVWRLGWKRGLAMVLVTALCVTLTDQFANLIKETAGRVRPCLDQTVVERGLHILEHGNPRHPYGFFSAHAGNAAVFAVCTSVAFRYDRRCHTYQTAYTWFAGVWAFMVGVSRIFVGKHFAGDVIVGFAVGLVFACLLCLAERKIVAHLTGARQ